MAHLNAASFLPLIVEVAARCWQWRNPVAQSAQPLGRLARVIGEDHVRAGALDAGEDFQGDPALVDPALRGGGLDHGELAADVVGRYRNAEAIFDPANNV